MTTVADVIEIALALPLNDRCYVTSKLIESLELDEQLTQSEIAEYDARVARYERGETRSSSSEELDAKIKAILNR